MNYCHTYTRSPTSQKVGRAFVIAIFAHIIFTALEAIFALYAHSSSLLADAGHNFGDIVGLTLAWYANYLQMRKPSERFSYGYKRTSVLASFLNAIILITTAVLIALSSIRHLLEPHVVAEKTVIIVAALGIILNTGTALLFREDQHDLNVKAAFLHLFFDALIALGVVFVGIAIHFTHWYWLDPLVGLLITLVISLGTWKLFKSATHLILDAVPQQIDIKKVLAYLQSWPDVTEVHDLHIWGLSTTEVALTAHLIMPLRYLDDNEYLLLEESLYNNFGISHVTVQVERGTMRLKTHDFCKK